MRDMSSGDARIDMPFPTLREVIKDAANISAVVFGLSLIASYSYNLMYFHNIDNNIFPQSFLPLINSSDYISSSFIFVPPVILIYFMSWSVSSLVGVTAPRFLRHVVGFRSVLRVASKASFMLKVIRISMHFVHRFIVRVTPGAGFERYKRLFYVFTLLLWLVISILISLTSTNIHQRYVYLIFIFVTMYMIFIWVRHFRFLSNIRMRVVYSSIVTISFFFLVGGTLGNYMYDLSVLKTKRYLNFEVSVDGGFVSKDKESRVTAVSNRALDKGLFFIDVDRSEAVFISWDGNFMLKRPVVIPANKPFICKYVDIVMCSL